MGAPTHPGSFPCLSNRQPWGSPLKQQSSTGRPRRRDPSILEGETSRWGQEADGPIYTPARWGFPRKGWGWSHRGSPSETLLLPGTSHLPVRGIAGDRVARHLLALIHFSPATQEGPCHVLWPFLTPQGGEDRQGQRWAGRTQSGPLRFS